MTIDEMRSRLDEVKERLSDLHQQYVVDGEDLSDGTREEWDRLNDERDELTATLDEKEAMAARMKELNDAGEGERAGTSGAHFQTRNTRARGNEIYDLSTIRSSFSDPEAANRELVDRAQRAAELNRYPHDHVTSERAQEAVKDLLERVDHPEEVALRVLQTGSPAYKRGWSKKIAGHQVTPEEERALSTTTTAGGFAVPFALDPTIIPTSNLSVNPYRAISNVKTITVSKWEGVSSAGVTAAFSSEATQASDNAPAVDQPTVTPAKAQAFIPFSIEIGQDWGGLQTEMARLLQDAKDDLEADRFTFGTASTPEPEGVVKAGTAFVNTASSATFAIADLYSLEQALGPRFRPRASFIGNRAIYNKVRQFDTAGGAGLWVRVGEGLPSNVPTPGSLGNNLLGYPAYEVSPMTTAITSNSLFLMVGDFSYFVIVDRVGMDIELIPHLFGANQRPTGQRGLYAYWRTGSTVVSTNAFRILKSL